MEGSRRQLTVLFCDIIESTELASRLDPEDWRDLLTSYHRVCRDAIGQYAGHISQFLGDGVLSYFGYPVAEEGDAVRAVRAALRIVEDLKLLNSGIGKALRAELHVRAGIHTGITVLTDTGRQDRLAIGDTVNLAARIQGFAEEDAVVVSEATARLVEGHFVLRSLDAQTLKGFRRSVELFQVVESTGARSAFEAAARGPLTAYIGRERQLDELSRAWEEVQHGAGRAVLLRGEAGIGKSRLMHHFRHKHLEPDARVIQLFCSPMTEATALAPVVEMLHAQLDYRAQLGGGRSKLAALGELLSEYPRVEPDALPLMANLLSLAGADQAPIADLSPLRRRSRTLEVLRTWLAWSAERVPSALLVEDLHWADPSTLELLEPMLQAEPPAHTLLCVTARPEFSVRRAGAHVRQLELVRMTAQECEAIVTHVAGGHTLPPLVLRQIAQRSEGVPLFVEEVTKTVLESGALQFDDNRYRLAQGLDDRSLPATVQGSLVARFDRLKESRGVAQRGAAIGRDFTYSLIHAVADLPEAELRAHLDVLARSGMVILHGEPPASRYIFKHALIQDAIYGTLLKSERARVHERIFSVLQERFPEVVSDRPEMAAYHAERAGRREAAVPLLRAAGLSAFKRTAMLEAVQHLAHAIELVEVLEEPDRSAMEMELQAAISSAYMATVGWAAPEVERSSSRLRALAAARGDASNLFLAMWGLWTVHFIRGKLDQALDVAREVQQMAMQTEDPTLREATHHALGYTHFYRGEYALAIEHADAGLALFDLERETRIAAAFQLSPGTGMWCYRSQALQMLGRFQESAAGIRNCRQLAEDLDHAPSRAFLLNLCYCFRLQGDLANIKAIASASRALSVAEGFGFWVSVADILLAWVSAQEGGDPTAACERIAAARRLLHAGGTYIAEPEFACMHAESLLLAQQPEEAQAILRSALTVTRADLQQHCQPELYRLQGEAARALGQREPASELFRSAIEGARAMAARLLELRATLALARLDATAEVHAELRALVDALEPEAGELQRLGGAEHPDVVAARVLLAATFRDN